MNVARIAAVMSRGIPVVLPTDTVYALAARATDPTAVARLFGLKNRPVETRIAALVSDSAQAEELVELGPMGDTLARAFWPGSLTIVAARRPGCDLVVGDEFTVGVRCPACVLVRQLAEVVGPIAATSANRHGELTPSTAAGVAAVFPSVELVVDGGRLAGGASTVVSIADGKVTVLRQGPISGTDIDAAVSGGS